MDKLKEAFNEIENFYTLRQNWDHEGAERISSTSVENAKWFLENYVTRPAQIPGIFPDACGGVRFEWEGKNQYAEILFLTNGDMEFYTRHYRPERIKERSFTRVSTAVERVRKHFTALPLIAA